MKFLDSFKKLFSKKALKKFDIISCQFSFHYYFENIEMLNSYLTNISENCKKGGYFIGTCYDGTKIFNMLRDSGDQEFKDLNDSLIYSIEKKYDISDFRFNPENLDNMFGQKIDVYMESIGQVITEYLVNFEFLKQYMEQNGFKLMSPTVKNKYSNIFRQDYITHIRVLGFDPLFNSDFTFNMYGKEDKMTPQEIIQYIQNHTFWPVDMSMLEANINLNVFPEENLTIKDDISITSSLHGHPNGANSYKINIKDKYKVPRILVRVLGFDNKIPICDVIPKSKIGK